MQSCKRPLSLWGMKHSSQHYREESLHLVRRAKTHANVNNHRPAWSHLHGK
ncbi:hypothetical protein I79_026019 [Cricetulus griseus]|uniref:Uncharacterized protein n=1 Tax=Cricetulus griseus TaxID=10029 RepID=G3IPU1_CRIGR|nr:hypothetical protein I79_026019 [Cricetulus griseus]